MSDVEFCYGSMGDCYNLLVILMIFNNAFRRCSLQKFTICLVAFQTRATEEAGTGGRGKAAVIRTATIAGQSRMFPVSVKIHDLRRAR
jgi:hypothetical protein